MNNAEKKQVMILGAGLMQKPAILAARELGLQTVVVDANAKAPCVPLADRFEQIDLKDRERLLSFARELAAEPAGLAGVFTAGTDFSASVSYVAEHCGLPAHSFESCLNASDKLRMRACFKQYGVPSPAFIEVRPGDVVRLKDLARHGRLDYPKVVKPCDNMGGRGCRMIRSKEEFFPAVEDAVHASRSSRAILEDYMEGAEFSIDSIVYKGTLTITGFADRHIYYPPYFIETGHTMPTAISEQQRLELIATFALGIKALGLSCGVAKADIKYTKNGPMIGEIAARLSGGYMSGWTYPYASDEPLTKYALQIALGQEPADLIARRVPLAWAPHESVAGEKQPFALYELPCKRVSAERAWISIPGTVAEVRGLAAAAQVEGVRDVLPRVKAGDEVRFPRNNVEKGGNVIAVAASRSEAEAAAFSAISKVVLRLTPFSAETDSFLRGDCAMDEAGFPPPAFPAALAAFKRASENPAEALSARLLSPQSLLSQLPAVLAPFAADPQCMDWNHLTIPQALSSLAKVCGDEAWPPLAPAPFWTAFLQGSVQGALYLLDCARAREKAGQPPAAEVRL